MVSRTRLSLQFSLKFDCWGCVRALASTIARSLIFSRCYPCRCGIIVLTFTVTWYALRLRLWLRQRLRSRVLVAVTGLTVMVIGTITDVGDGYGNGYGSWVR